MSNEKSQETVANRMEEIKREIAAKAFSDSAFRERLLAEPKAALQSEYSLPEDTLDGLNINVIEEQPGVLTIPIPPSMDEVELSDDQLEAVVGGVTPAIFTIVTIAASCAGIIAEKESSW